MTLSVLSPADAFSTMVLSRSPQFAKALCDALRVAGLRASQCETIENAEWITAGTFPEVVVVDWQVSDAGVKQFVKSVRRLDANVRVVVVGSLSPDDAADVLDSGADLCLIHPISDYYFVANIRALIRRGESLASGWTRKCGIVKLDLLSQTLEVDGRQERLSLTPFNLLWALPVTAAAPATAAELMQRIRPAGKRVNHRSLVRELSIARAALRRVSANQADIVWVARQGWYIHSSARDFSRPSDHGAEQKLV